MSPSNELAEGRMRLFALITLCVGACQTTEPPPSPPTVDGATQRASPGRDDRLVERLHTQGAPLYRAWEDECAVRYLPDACTEAAVADQWVDVVGSVSCTGMAQPGTIALAEFLDATFPWNEGYGLYNCRNIAGTTSYSLHSEGRAIDFMVPLDPTQPYSADNTLGDAVADFLLEHAEDIGIQSFIWDRTIFYGDEAAPKHHCTTIEDGHWNHLHIELTWDGANMLTPWFNVPEEPAMAEVNTGATLPTVTLVGTPQRVRLQTPERVFDTRDAAQSTGLVRDNGTRTGPLTAGGTSTFDDWGLTSAPADSAGVWLNLVGIGGIESGFLSAWPAGRARPDTSNLNLSCRQPVRANAVPVALEGGNGVSFYSRSEVHAVADLYATFGPTGSGLRTVAQQRLLDTRTSTPMSHTEVRSLRVDNQALGITGAGSPEGLVGTVAVLAGANQGYLTAWPCDEARPVASTINFQAGMNVANALFVPLSSQGELCLYAHGTDDVHVIVDASAAVVPSGPLDWQAVVPQRLLDTRSASSAWVGRLAGAQSVSLDIRGLPNVPSDTEAVTVNLTTLGADRSGFVEAWPCDEPTRPDVSSINFSSGLPTAASAVVPLGPSGELCLYGSTRTHLLVDLLGVWVPDAGGSDTGGGDTGGSGNDTGTGGNDTGSSGNDTGTGGNDTGSSGNDTGTGGGDAGDSGSTGGDDRQPLPDEPGGCGCSQGPALASSTWMIVVMGGLFTAGRRRVRRR